MGERCHRAIWRRREEVYKACKQRVVFVTARDYIGLAAWSARVGDKVFVLKGERRCSYCARWIEDRILMIMGGEGLDLCNGGLRDVR